MKEERVSVYSIDETSGVTFRYDTRASRDSNSWPPSGKPLHQHKHAISFVIHVSALERTVGSWAGLLNHDITSQYGKLLEDTGLYNGAVLSRIELTATKPIIKPEGAIWLQVVHNFQDTQSMSECVHGFLGFLTQTKTKAEDERGATDQCNSRHLFPASLLMRKCSISHLTFGVETGINLWLFQTFGLVSYIPSDQRWAMLDMWIGDSRVFCSKVDNENRDRVGSGVQERSPPPLSHSTCLCESVLKSSGKPRTEVQFLASNGRSIVCLKLVCTYVAECSLQAEAETISAIHPS
ncbi:hypothetical protein AG4045_025967 [Apium graveolens]|uniref:Uncharacterized protein n=1 Tax=Apium graveolens TaxID=4045 RepID=A0A6L5BB17_APIGR|nr:hypothetical protein AG4045_025967 [Apium graveolens]